jgi:hypothetical protein
MEQRSSRVRSEMARRLWSVALGLLIYSYVRFRPDQA